MFRIRVFLSVTVVATLTIAVSAFFDGPRGNPSDLAEYKHADLVVNGQVLKVGFLNEKGESVTTQGPGFLVDLKVSTIHKPVPDPKKTATAAVKKDDMLHIEGIAKRHEMPKTKTEIMVFVKRGQKGRYTPVEGKDSRLVFLRLVEKGKDRKDRGK